MIEKQDELRETAKLLATKGKGLLAVQRALQLTGALRFHPGGIVDDLAQGVLACGVDV